MKKLITLIVLLAMLAMLSAPAVVAAPPDENNSMAGTDGDEPEGGTGPPIAPPPEPPDEDPWEPGIKMVVPDNNDNADNSFISIFWSIKIFFISI